jgi:hypothetical protein
MQANTLRWTVPLLLVGLSLAGCVGDQDPAGDALEAPMDGDWAAPRVMTGAAFTPTHILDSLRAGGEPVIAITDQGTIIVSAHPGYTHYHPTPASPELIIPTQGQSYLWRSTDGGESWEHVSLVDSSLPNTGPRGVGGHGVSDPELTIDENGRIWLTDLEALAESSVSWSDDDGQTWLLGNDVASGGVTDRQWLASIGGTVFFTANYLGGPTVWGAPDGPDGLMRDVIASEDGIVWEARGATPCNGDMVANRVTEILYQACGNGILWSEDGARTWTRADGPLGCGLCEPSIDAAGTVYQAGGYEDAIALTFTKDNGVTWAEPLNVTDYFDDLSDGFAWRWPWTSAGSDGRVAVTWLAAPGASGASDVTAEWHAYTVIVTNATGNGTTEVWPVKLTSEPLHIGAICVGTTCQVKTPDQDENDRRMGDFFETTISPDGVLHVVYSNTQAYADHGVSHVAFHKQVSGPSLVVGEVPAGFPTQG